MNPYYLDLMPDYIPFAVQCKDELGEITGASYIVFTIYESNDKIYDSEENVKQGAFTKAFSTAFDVSGGGAFSKAFSRAFDISVSILQLGNKTGLYVILIPKSSFSITKHYRILWEATINDTQTAKKEQFYACNSTSFQG